MSSAVMDPAVGTAGEQMFLDELVRHGHFLPSGEPGIYGRGMVFEEVRNRFDALVTRVCAPDKPETPRFPPVIPKRTLEKAGYLKSFPQLCGAVYSFAGKEGAALELAERASRGEDWSHFLSMTDVVLVPAACYPAYPAMALRGPLPHGGVTLDLGGSYVFRNEPSGDPARLQMFHQREMVRIGEADDVIDWRETWMKRAQDIFEQAGLDATLSVASDPFFGRGGKLMANNQRQQGLKFEVLVPIASPEPTAVSSFNFHQDHFGSAFGIRLHDGAVANSACLGFGLERITLALFRAHGMDPKAGQQPFAIAFGLRPALLIGDPVMLALLGLDPGSYVASALHQPDRTFPETNCYVDIWIELLHVLGIDPASAMAFACTVDFEGDQWTFFKPPPDELERLYGIDVHEMQLYRPVVDHVVEQLKAGRSIIIEADAFYMPDRVATSYRNAHVKSSIALEAIDPEHECLRYFHGPGFYELSGDDYRGIFRLGRAFSQDVLPPYAELVRFDAGPRLSGEDLRRAAFEMLGRQLGRIPERNPWLKFGERLAQDLPALLDGADADFHAYAFATARQCGAAFDAAKSFVEWLALPASSHASAAAEALGRQVNGAKAFLFRLARRKFFDPAPAVGQLAGDWETAMDALNDLAFGARRGAA